MRQSEDELPGDARKTKRVFSLLGNNASMSDSSQAFWKVGKGGPEKVGLSRVAGSRGLRPSVA